MPGRSKVTAGEPERAELRALARSSRRSEADRARAILLTLAGRRASDIAAGLGVHVSTVREWRGAFSRGRIAALRRRKPPGRPCRVGREAVALAAAILAEDTRHDGGWTLPRLRGEIQRRGGPAISTGWLSVQLRQRGSSGDDRGPALLAGRTGMPSRARPSA